MHYEAVSVFRGHTVAWTRVVAVEVEKSDHFGLEARGSADEMHVEMIKKIGAGAILLA